MIHYTRKPKTRSSRKRVFETSISYLAFIAITIISGNTSGARAKSVDIVYSDPLEIIIGIWL